MNQPDEKLDREDAGVVATNARYGLGLFAVYVIFYAAFVALSAFAPGVMAKMFGGVNLAIVYGFGLIVLAFVLAVIYMLMCGDSSRGDPRGRGSGRGDGEGRA